MRNEKRGRKGRATFQRADTAAGNARGLGRVTYLGGELGRARLVLVGPEGSLLCCISPVSWKASANRDRRVEVS